MRCPGRAAAYLGHWRTPSSERRDSGGLRSTLMPSFSVAIASADALTAANRRLAAALGEEEEKLRRPVLVRSWSGAATIGLAISLNKLLRVVANLLLFGP